MAIQVGQIVDGYQIMQELGRGGNGIVFSAKSVNGEHTVAIKFPWQKRLKQDPSLVDSFLHEAAAIARLEHPYIARHFRAGVYPMEDGKIPYLMMELVQGKPAAYLRKAALHRIVIAMEKVAEAIYHAHKQRVIHCDLKPTNILIDNFGNPKILDFGLARMLIDRVNSNSGVFQGTPLYAAPEQYQGKADERTDIWSLGAILFDLLTGRPPFVAENWEELSSVQNLFASQEMAMHLRTPRPSRLNPTVDSELDHICAKAMAKDPQKRYQSTDEMAEALKKWIRRRRDELVAKAHKQVSLCRFLPRRLRQGLLHKAYDHLQQALAHDMATVALKELLLRLFYLQDNWEVALLEIAVPKTWEEWRRLNNILEAIVNSYNRYLSPLVQTVLGVVSPEELPHQILLIYRKPFGKNLSQQLGHLSREEVLDLAQAILDVTTQMSTLGLNPALPEAEEIFVRPLKIVPVGWWLRREKEVTTVNLATMMYQALTGTMFQESGTTQACIPQKWRTTLLGVLQGKQQFASLANFLSALEYQNELHQILVSGSLDHTFLWPGGDFCLATILRIEKSGHLKMYGQITLRCEAETAIECYGQLTIQGSWHKEQQIAGVQLVAASNSDGWGGICLDSSDDHTHVLQGLLVQGACSKRESGEATSGGAICLKQGKLKVSRAVFKDNRVSGDGGAICARGNTSHPAELDLSEVVFSDNSAGRHGGAVAATYVRASYEECSFHHNTSHECGGAVYMEGEASDKYSEIIFRNSRFSDNEAAQGGACQLGMFTRAKLDNCMFSKNRAVQKGGALYIYGQAKNNNQATFNLVCFSENLAHEEGGALYFAGYALILLEAGEFSQNKSLGNGGAIGGDGQKAESPSKITLRQVALKHNQTQQDGGAISLGPHTRAILDDCTLEANRAEMNCGAICIIGEAGGETSKIKLRKVTFRDNQCQMDGGAMTAGCNTQMILEECRFYGNCAEGNCGAIGLAGKDAHSLSEGTFRNVEFNDNRATQDGGALLIGRYTRTKFEACRWEKNCAEKKTGGAILLLGKDGASPTLAEFYDCIFTGNYCGIDGGALNLNIYTQATLERCELSENYVIEKNGGAVVLLGKDGAYPTKATFRQTAFRNNRCQISGGALNANDYTRSLFVECIFENNQAVQKNGGAVLVLGEDGQYPSEARFHKVTFRQNRCKGSGGAVNANVYTITLFEECQFDTNSAEENGGGIFIRGLRRLPNKATIKSCRFSDNIAGKVGADVALKAVKGVTEESLLQENTIEIQGPDFAAEDEEEILLSSDEKVEDMKARRRTSAVQRIATEIPKHDTEAEDTEERRRPEQETESGEERT
jgi:predicted outer membrane repeat protein